MRSVNLSISCFCVLWFVTGIDACGGGKKGGKGTALQKSMGNDVNDIGPVSSEKYDNNNGAIQSMSDLSCSGADRSGCCWRQHPRSDIPWIIATGKADSRKVKQNFGNDVPPDGPGFLAAYQDTKQDASKMAVMESCAIPCVDGNIQMSLTSWQSDATTLQACVVPADSTSPSDRSGCRDIPEGTATVSLSPLSEPFRILLIASGFTDRRGSVVAMDKLSASGRICNDANPGPGPGPGPNPNPTSGPGNNGGSAVCSALACTFDSNNKCSYQEASGSQWRVTNSKIGNPATGVKKAAPGSEPYFAGVELDPGQKAVLKSGPFSTGSTPKELKFKAYEATYEIELKACLNSENNCPWRSNPQVDPSDTQWKEAAIPLDANTREVMFVATNVGQQHGAAGIDDIRVFSQSGSREC